MCLAIIKFYKLKLTNHDTRYEYNIQSAAYYIKTTLQASQK